MDRLALKEACEAVPLFPLPGVVLFPNTVMPLHVFEQRYRDLVKDCLEGNGVLGVPLLAPGWEDGYDGQPPVHPIAGVGQIIESRKLPDGRYNIAVLGVGRIRIVSEYPTDQLYRIARADLLEENLPAGGVDALRAPLEQLRLLLAQLLMLHPRLQADLGKLVEVRDPSFQMVDALAHLVFQEPEQRQRYIEEDDLLARTEQVSEGLAGIIARSTSNIPEA
ncbi:MAG: LON peptidase substrate-binding domain-containing protein [Myxococcota bacterium]